MQGLAAAPSQATATAHPPWLTAPSAQAPHPPPPPLQCVELDFQYPSEGIHRRWDAGYRITSCAATPDQAAFVLRCSKPPCGRAGRAPVLPGHLPSSAAA
jgi:hypothetical protein